MISRSVGAFSQREMVGCEQRSLPVSGSRPHASLKAEIEAQPVEVVAIGIAAANRQHAGAQDIRNRVRDVRGIAMVGNKRGKRISNCAPAIGQCEQHHAATRTIMGSNEAALLRLWREKRGVTPSNAWAEFAAIFTRTRSAHLEHEQAKTELRRLTPEDARQAIGHGIRARRSKSGAISFDVLPGEGTHAAVQ